jgi:hypothetical protein
VTFPARVEAWRPLLAQYAGDIPVDFLLAWVQRESNGNVCSYTRLRESGIFQLMPPDNTNAGGTTEAALRTSCIGNTQLRLRPATPAENTLQVTSGIRYVEYARARTRAKLAAAGATWSESSPDFWMAVKLYHALPSALNYLQTYTKIYGRPPRNWAEFTSVIPSADTRSLAWLENARWVGSFGLPTQGPITADPNEAAMTGDEVFLVGIAAILGLAGAIYFNRWVGQKELLAA